MIDRKLLVALVSVIGGTASAQVDVRGRAAQDLACKAVKIQDWGSKVEARGCGRNAEYERKPTGLDLVMLELEPTAEMRGRAAAELGCTDLEVTRTFTRELGDQLIGMGCRSEVHFDVEGGNRLTLKSVVGPAPANIAAQVAADLGCPATLPVTLTRDGAGVSTASANDCRGDQRTVQYSLAPFKRIAEASGAPVVATKAEVSTYIPKGDVEEVERVQALKERAARDLGCPDAASVVVNLTKTANKTADAREGDLSAMGATACGRHARYERAAGPGLTLTYVEKVVPAEWTGQIAKDMACPLDKLEIHRFAFPEKAGPEQLGAKGCDKQGSYQIEASGPKLVYQVGTLPADTADKLAKELGCPRAQMKGELIRRGAKDPWAATGTCPGGAKTMFNLSPFRKIGPVP